MIVSEATINDATFAFAKTKINKNIMDFMSDFCYRMGAIIEQDGKGFIAELHSAIRLDDPEITGTIHVTY